MQQQSQDYSQWYTLRPLSLRRFLKNKRCRITVFIHSPWMFLTKHSFKKYNKRERIFHLTWKLYAGGMCNTIHTVLLRDHLTSLWLCHFWPNWWSFHQTKTNIIATSGSRTSFWLSWKKSHFFAFSVHVDTIVIHIYKTHSLRIWKWSQAVIIFLSCACKDNKLILFAFKVVVF